MKSLKQTFNTMETQLFKRMSHDGTFIQLHPYSRFGARVEMNRNTLSVGRFRPRLIRFHNQTSELLEALEIDNLFIHMDAYAWGDL